MNSHTPAPWRTSYVFKAGKKRYEMDVWAGQHLVATLPPTGSQEQQEADGQLIAAAPALLAAVYAALPYIETAEDDAGYKPGAVAKITQQLRDAIAAAESD